MKIKAKNTKVPTTVKAGIYAQGTNEQVIYLFWENSLLPKAEQVIYLGVDDNEFLFSHKPFKGSEEKRIIFGGPTPSVYLIGKFPQLEYVGETVYSVSKDGDVWFIELPRKKTKALSR